MKKKNSAFPGAAPASRAGMKARWLCGGFFLALTLASCSARGTSIRSMPLEYRQFISEVRYIISAKERKIFKGTPAEERARFVEEFWKVRDPDPTTEENEFRDEYYRRIDVANHLFREGGAGWLSDRGRILILLGEPERRDTYPSGYSFYEPPVEIWYYGNFPIIFVDYEREGFFKLEPGSVRRMSMINGAQMQLKPKGIERNVRSFDFTLAFQVPAPGSARLVMEVPYRVTNLVLNEASNAYETQIRLTVRIRDPQGQAVLEKEELRPVSVAPSMLADLGKNLVLEFAFQLPAGDYSAMVLLENTADRTQASKEIKFKL